MIPEQVLAPLPPRTTGNKYYRDDSDSDESDSGASSTSSMSPPQTPASSTQQAPQMNFFAKLMASGTRDMNATPPAKGTERKEFLKHYYHNYSEFSASKQADEKLFKRFASLHESDPKHPSPFNSLPPTQLLKLLKTWRFKRDDEYDNSWETPIPPWISRNTAAKMAEMERENAERQLMLIEDLATSELEGKRANYARKVNDFCFKVANYLLAKAMPPMWVKVDERQNERLELNNMARADVMSKVEEKRYKKELEEKKYKFLSTKKLEYKRWIKGEKKAVKMFEKFKQTKKLKIDWYCDNAKCEFRNFKLVYVCEMCGAKHDPKWDVNPAESGSGGGGGNKTFFRRRARRAEKQRLEDLAKAITRIVKIDEGVAERNVGKIVGEMEGGADSVNVQVRGSEAMGSLSLDGRSAEIVQLDGLRLVVEAMDRFEGNAFVQRAACKLLLNICLDRTGGIEGMRTAYRAGVIPAVVAAMRDLPYDSIVQWTGTQIFMRVCFVDEDFGRMIWRSGGLLCLQKVWELRKQWSVQRVFR